MFERVRWSCSGRKRLLLELIVAAAGSVQRGVFVVELLRAWGQLGKKRRLMEVGECQVLKRTSRKGSTVVSHCCELLGTSQKCLNMHFFDEAPKLPHQTDVTLKVDLLGVGQARFTRRQPHLSS